MKVNQKILSIPPYISTAWKNVLSLHLDRREVHPILVIGLVNGSTIEIPQLDPSDMEAIFDAHQKHLEQETLNLANQKEAEPPMMLPGINIDNASNLMGLPVRFGIDGNLLQHNSEASDSPDLPKEILEKIATLSKVIGFENSDNFPKAEPHCNCMHCQIMRVLRQEREELVEEEVLDIDLKFREWDINQTGDKLYIVSSPLNSAEQYNVFLGNPVGCTCGQQNCEHIRAVLNS